MSFPIMWVCRRKGSCSSILLGVCCSLTSRDFAGVDIPGHPKNTDVQNICSQLVEVLQFWQL